MKVKYDENGLVPVVTQDVDSKAVLMLAYMNEQALNLTKSSRYAHYYSRSRKEIWKKGATSGNLQQVVNIHLDCDNDTILLEVKQIGNACHNNTYTCFNTKTEFSFFALYRKIQSRKLYPRPNSYTNELLLAGVNKIVKKVGEEATEISIAALAESKQRLISEIGDFMYHLLVLMVAKDVSINDVLAELKKRNPHDS